MKRGFTLLELIIVIIIIGVLATLGFTQYGRMIEKSRGAEAKVILGDIRKFAAAYVLEETIANIGAMTAADLNIGTGADQIPSACATSHYFSYGIPAAPANPLVITATRCAASGKTPDSTLLCSGAACTLTLTTNLTTGVDTWGGTGNY